MNAEALSLRRLDNKTREQFEAYFNQGMNTAAASEFHSNQLDLDPDIINPAIARADASVNPSRAAVSHLFSKWREINLGKRHGEKMWSFLESKADIQKFWNKNLNTERATSNCNSYSINAKST